MNVDDFKVKQLMGSGLYSVVNEVELKGDFSPKRTNALKRTRLTCKETIKRVLQERKALEMITTDKRIKNSPFLPQLYAAFIISGSSAALVIPVGSGANLYVLWNTYCPFSDEEVRFNAAEILCGLEALHALHIVRVDLKSSNVIIMPSGHIMIIDFDHSLDISSGPRHHFRQHVGTTIYSPSEVAKGDFISEKSDVWCWAMVLLELLCENNCHRNFAIYAAAKNKFGLRNFRCSETLKSLLQWCLKECSLEQPCLSAIKMHGFFSDIKWEDVELCKLEPPERLDASKCYRAPRKLVLLVSLVLKILKESEAIDLDVEIANSNNLNRYEREKVHEESVLQSDEFKADLEKFDFVHAEEFKMKKEEMREKEKKNERKIKKEESRRSFVHGLNN